MRLSTRFAFGIAFVLAGSGCLDRRIEPLKPRLTQTSFDVIPFGRVDKIDLLLAIDNSVSMEDKQAILGDAIPTLVGRFVNPFCIDPSAQPVAVESIPQPADSSEVCPVIDVGGAQVQTEREFEPIKDIHVGIVSSSLGDLGSGACSAAQTIHRNDDGELLDRTAPVPPDTSYGEAPTFQGKGFLAWDPDGKYGDPTAPAAFESTLKDMVVGVGQKGCGYEMQLESVYRFLVDPEPYASLLQDPVSGDNVKDGINQDILDQRKAFLRPDSLVAVLMLSDENDCSVAATGPNFAVLSGGFERGSSACDADPNDACCYSCSRKNPPSGCAADPVCEGFAETDHNSANTRCWDQKRRFGADFLYPTERYVNAFSLKSIDPSRGSLVPEKEGDGVANPLLAGRPPRHVYFAAIVGVPWQAIAEKNEAGQPDLTRGFMSTADMERAGLFEQLVGDPDHHIPPTDPFMVEDVEKRGGMSQLLGVDPSKVNDINGGDRTPVGPAEINEMGLQYACTFPIDPEEGGPDCGECSDGVCDNPVCDGTTQIRAKAVPGLRQLAVVRGMDTQGIAASVCPGAQTNDSALDYGYTPAVSAIINALKSDLQGVQCLDFSLKPNEADQVQCIVLESSRDQACTCADRPGHFKPPADHEVAIEQVKTGQYYEPEQTCFCEVEQLQGEALDSCQNDKKVGDDVDGWCYVDKSPGNAVGNAALIPELCGDYDARIVRVVGDGQPTSGSTLHIWCSGESAD